MNFVTFLKPHGFTFFLLLQFYPFVLFFYFVRVEKYCTNEPGGSSLHYLFCTAARWEASLRVTEGLVTAFTARKRALLYDELIIDALYTLDRYFYGLSCLADLVIAGLACQT